MLPCEICGTQFKALRRLKIHITRRHRSIDLQEIIRLYIGEQLSLKEIAGRYGVSNTPIKNALLKAGAKIRTTSEVRKLTYKKSPHYGKLAPGWKGGRTRNAEGYIRVYITSKRGHGAYEFEHRRIWEQYHGPLQDGWVVHHINGIKNDNGIENLIALPKRGHINLMLLKEVQAKLRKLENEIRRIKSQRKLAL